MNSGIFFSLMSAGNFFFKNLPDLTHRISNGLQVTINLHVSFHTMLPHQAKVNGQPQGHEGNKAFKYEFCVKKSLPQRANKNHHAALFHEEKKPIQM